MNARRLELLDTSVVLELLRVPYECDRHEETVRGFEERAATGAQLHLPVAAVMQAGGHVGRIDDGFHRRECALRLSKVIEATISRTAPWSFEPLEWNDALLGELLVPGVEPEVEPLPILPLAESLAQQHLELGDLLIISEFRRLRRNLDRRVVTVDVWTYDNGLRATVDSLLGR